MYRGVLDATRGRSSKLEALQCEALEPERSLPAHVLCQVLFRLIWLDPARQLDLAARRFHWA
jgi:hypothetical protein